jgi:hypothetical protein
MNTEKETDAISSAGTHIEEKKWKNRTENTSIKAV